MKKMLSLYALFSLIVFSLHAQNSFQRIITVGFSSFSNANSIQQTSDGGYILAGTDSSSAAQNRDVFLVKTDANGDTLWARSYGTNGFEYGQYVIQCGDGGYLAVGTSESTNWNVYLIKTDANGDSLWTRLLGAGGDDEANSVQETSDGNFIIAGYTNSYGAGNYDYFLAKIDNNGNILWSNAYGTLQDELGYFVQETTDKGFIFSGAAAALNSTIDAYVIKTDSVGAVQWSNYYGTLSTDWGYMMRQTNDSGYVLTGYVGAGAATDILLIKTDKLGDTAWTRTYGDASYEGGLCVTQTPDSGYVISGSVYSGSMGGSDAMLLTTDAEGNFLYCHGFGGTGDDWAPAFVQTSDQGFALGAYTSSLTGGPRQFYLVKTDSAGNADGLCNQVNISLITTPRAFAVAAVTTVVTPFVFTLISDTTNVDSSVLAYSPCISLGNGTHSEASFHFTVYPNPSSGIFNLRAENSSSPWISVEITNVLGQPVYSQKWFNPNGKINKEVDLNGFAPGTYFIQLRSADGTTTSRVILDR